MQQLNIKSFDYGWEIPVTVQVKDDDRVVRCNHQGYAMEWTSIICNGNIYKTYALVCDKCRSMRFNDFSEWLQPIGGSDV